MEKLRLWRTVRTGILENNMKNGRSWYQMVKCTVHPNQRGAMKPVFSLAIGQLINSIHSHWLELTISSCPTPKAIM